MQCPRCGKRIPADDRYCAYCGAASGQGQARPAVAAGGGATMPIVAGVLTAVVIVLAGIGAYAVSHARRGGLAGLVTNAVTTSLLITGSAAPSRIAATPTPTVAPTATPRPVAVASSVGSMPVTTSAGSTASSGIATSADTGLHGTLLFAFNQGNLNPGVITFVLPAGPETTPIPADADIRQAVWLPDGGSFICVDEANASILRITGSSRQRLAGGWNPALSPDGTKLLYVGKPGGGEVMLANVDGSGAVSLTPGSSANIGPVFSPDGSKIAFARKTSGIWQVWIMDAGGGNARQVSHSTDHARFPVWSPDGRQLAYNTAERDESTPKDIWLIDADGANARQLVTGHQNGRPFWTPNAIYFNSDRDKVLGRSDIYAVQPDGSGLRRVTNSASDLSYYNPVWRGT